MEKDVLIYKIVLVGNSGVGKTCMLLSFADDASFQDVFVSTIGVDFRFRTIIVDDKKIKLQIWDTAGQERFRTITSAYYRGAQGMIFVYDITNRESFDDVEQWIADVDKVRKDHKLASCLVGAKADLQDQRQVSSEEGKAYAEANDMFFLETSSKTKTNVETLFFALTKELLEKNTQSVPKVISAPPGKKKECCS